jgi:hypothetical protein
MLTAKLDQLTHADLREDSRTSALRAAAVELR